MRPLMGIAAVFLALACRPSEEPKRGAVSKDRDPGGLQGVQDQGSVQAEATAEALVREAVRDFMVVAERCDQAHFAHVEPERIKRWELPVDVKAMESECDVLLQRFSDLLDRGALRHPTLDRFLARSADVADRYLLLCLRCKKVGVRDRLPYIREVSALRDALRADVSALRDLGREVLTLTDDDLKAVERAPAGDIPRIAHEVFASLREDLRRLVEVPLREGAPIPRYALRLSDRRADRAVTLLRSRAMVQGQALLGPAEALTHAFSAAVNFFTRDYFNADEKIPPRVIREVVEADRKYRIAARRFLSNR